jgi:hypothetical protein
MSNTVQYTSTIWTTFVLSPCVFLIRAPAAVAQPSEKGQASHLPAPQSSHQKAHIDSPIARRPILPRLRVHLVVEHRHTVSHRMAASVLRAGKACPSCDACVVVEGQPGAFVEAGAHVAVDIVPVVIPLPLKVALQPMLCGNVSRFESVLFTFVPSPSWQMIDASSENGATKTASFCASLCEK